MTESFRLLISTGEVSGDLQGSFLIRALHCAATQRGWQLEIEAVGGPRMAEAGATLLFNTTSTGVIGVIEALPLIRGILAFRRQIRRHIQAFPPDLAVLIDYPGANIPIAKYLKQQQICPVVYYIAPQEWVWSFGQGTTRQIVAYTHQILAVFAQEAEYYKTHGARVTWVGHPFLDVLADWPSRTAARQRLGIGEEQKAIALLPASRDQELRHIWPVVAAAAQQIQAQCPEAHFWIPIALDSFRATLQASIDQLGLRATLTDQSQLVLAAADLAIGKSGTANLEAALLNVPQVVVYRIHPINGWLYRKLLRFKVSFISPVNLVQQTTVVPELLQEEVTPEAIAKLGLELLHPSARRTQMLEQYQQLRQSLGSPGGIQRAAEAILDSLTASDQGQSSYRDG
jgi:lipid-A-disaccharide synthase